MTENASSVSANPAVREQRRNKLLVALAGVAVLGGAVQADLPVKEFPDAPDTIQELYFCTNSGGRARTGCPSMLGYYADFALPENCPGHKAPEPQAPAEAAPS